MLFRSKKPSALQEALQGSLDFGERGIQQAGAGDQDQITSRHNLSQKGMDRGSQAPFGTIPSYRTTQRATDDQTYARERAFGIGHDQDDKRMSIRPTSLSHPLKIRGAR